MDFSFSEVQRELRAQAREWVRDRYPLERAHEVALSDDGWDEATWRELAELGWLGVSVPDELGGSGLTFVEEALLHEELGYALYDGPFLSTMLALPHLAAEDQQAVAQGDAKWSIEIDGLVPEWGRIDAVVGAELEGEELPSIDPTRPLGRLSNPSNKLLQGKSARALAALACEAVGVGQRALELAIEHAKTREQFGRPIGVYQAVSHKLADTYVETELARSLAYWAAWCVAQDDPQAELAAAAAKSAAGEAAVAACERSIQVHGGTGFTWEHVLHRYYKRAQWIEGFAGSPAQQRRAVAAALLD
jgi:alkylation response protein AidB-like acyl-CoA dehydrogenase